MSGEKTEQPTEKKLEDAKKKGQSPKSPDVNAAAGVLVATLCLAAGSAYAADHLRAIFDIVLERGVTSASGMALMPDMLKHGVLASLPFVGATTVAALASAFAQVGVQITFEPLAPDFDKINPASGLKKLFSLKSLLNVAKMAAKAVLLGVCVAVVIRGLIPILVGASLLSVQSIIAVSWAALLKLLGVATVIFVILGPADFAIQKWLFIREQRMSKDDIKREYKESEGDPLMKGMRKQLAMEMLHDPPRVAVPNASVVLANPTHYAVALRYEPGETAVPIVVAKGMDAVALEIRRLAEQARVPVVVNPPLARALYPVPVEGAVPEPLFEAVAVVLRWVRSLKMIGDELSGSGSPMHGATSP